MAETRIDIDVKDRRQWDRVRKQLRDMAARAKDVSPAWQALLTWFGEQNFDQFLTRGGRYHTVWPPLAASTQAEKLRQGHPLDPLIRTGALTRSLTSRPLGVEHVTPHEMVDPPRTGSDHGHISMDRARKEQGRWASRATWRSLTPRRFHWRELPS
jgi:hypothetical protein